MLRQSAREIWLNPRMRPGLAQKVVELVFILIKNEVLPLSDFLHVASEHTWMFFYFGTYTIASKIIETACPDVCAELLTKARAKNNKSPYIGRFCIHTVLPHPHLLIFQFELFYIGWAYMLYWENWEGKFVQQDAVNTSSKLCLSSCICPGTIFSVLIEVLKIYLVLMYFPKMKHPFFYYQIYLSKILQTQVFIGVSQHYKIDPYNAFRRTLKL